MAFNNFPYTNGHELNLDWVIKTCKEAAANALAAVTQSEETEQFVNDYFDNLDVQEEINTKINSMIASGEFGNIVDDYVPNVVTSWLNSHVSPETGYVLDNTLSVSGAAADAAAVGDLKLSFNTISTGETDLDSLVIQGAWTSTGGIQTNRPNRLVINKMFLVQKNDTLNFVGGNVNQYDIGYFDANTKTYIREGGYLNTGKTVFDNQYYIMVSFRKSNNNDLTPSDYDAHLTLESDVVQKNKLKKIIQTIESDNMFSKFMNDGYYMDLDGVVKPATSFGMSDYIKVKPSTTYNLYSFMRKNKLCGNVYVIYHDVLKNFISSITLQSAKRFTTPADCEWIVVSCAPSEANYLYLTDSATAPTVYKRYGQDTPFNVKSKYARPTWGNTFNWAKMGINLFGTFNGYPIYPHGSAYSFLAAAYEGFDAILIDLIATSDGYYVVSHDDNLYPYAKNSDGTALSNPWNIRQHTLAEVLALDMGYDYGIMYRGTQILTFEEALKFVKYIGMNLVVEMVYARGIPAFQAVVETVRNYGFRENVLFFAYYASELATVKDIIPEAGLLFYVAGDTATINNQITQAIALKTDKNKVIINQSATNSNPLTQAQIEQIIANNLYYSVSTPDSEPTGFLNFMSTKPLTSYITHFGTLDIPAYKMLMDS